MSMSVLLVVVLSKDCLQDLLSFILHVLNYISKNSVSHLLLALEDFCLEFVEFLINSLDVFSKFFLSVNCEEKVSVLEAVVSSLLLGNEIQILRDEACLLLVASLLSLLIDAGK